MTSKVNYDNVKTSLEEYKNELLLNSDDEIVEEDGINDDFDLDTVRKDYINIYLTADPDNEVKEITTNDSDKPEDFFKNIINTKMFAK